MSISNGVKANAENFNNSFLSRTSQSSVAGIVSLTNSQSESGAGIQNLQGFINQIASLAGSGSFGDVNNLVYDSDTNNLHFISNGLSLKVNLKSLDLALKQLSDRTATIEASIPKNNLVASSIPGATDDTTQGYSVGSFWLDTSKDKLYYCKDKTEGAAVWNELSGSSSGGGGGGSLDFEALGENPAEEVIVGIIPKRVFNMSPDYSEIWTSAVIPKGFAGSLQVMLRGFKFFSSESEKNVSIRVTAHLIKDSDPNDSGQMFVASSNLINLDGSNHYKIDLPIGDNNSMVGTSTMESGDILHIKIDRNKIVETNSADEISAYKKGMYLDFSGEV